MLTWIVIIVGVVLFGLILVGSRTPEARLREPIIDTSTVPYWLKVLIFISVICGIIIWLFG
jgi:hypothetical protein